MLLLQLNYRISWGLAPPNVQPYPLMKTEVGTKKWKNVQISDRLRNKSAQFSMSGISEMGCSTTKIFFLGTNYTGFRLHERTFFK
jgi:hypothetical protein